MNIVDKLTLALDLGVFHDAYREKIETMISFELKGWAVEVEEKKPIKRAANSMIEPLRESQNH